MKRTTRTVISPATSGSIKNLLPAILAFLLCAGLISVWVFVLSSENGEGKKRANKENITSEDIAHALNLTKWSVRLPDNLSLDDTVGIVLKKPDRERMIFGSKQYQAGSTISVLLQKVNNQYHWTIISEKKTLQHSTTLDQSENRSTYPLANESVREPGDFLILGTDRSNPGSTEKLKNGEFAFAVEIRKNND